MRKIDSIILYCSSTQEGIDIKSDSIKRWHVACNGWKDIGFHYIIDLDGTIEQGRFEFESGEKSLNNNNNSIDICYVGGRDLKMQPKDTRTKEQKNSMYRLIESMLDRYELSIENIYCFNEHNNNPSFNIDQFIKEYKEYLKNK